MASIKMRICNKCGRAIDLDDRYPGLSWEGKAGYGSKYDDETIELDLCCDCLDWFIDICMISPISEEDDEEEEEEIEF